MTKTEANKIIDDLLLSEKDRNDWINEVNRCYNLPENWNGNKLYNKSINEKNKILLLTIADYIKSKKNK